MNESLCYYYLLETSSLCWRPSNSSFSVLYETWTKLHPTVQEHTGNCSFSVLVQRLLFLHRLSQRTELLLLLAMPVPLHNRPGCVWLGEDTKERDPRDGDSTQKWVYFSRMLDLLESYLLWTKSSDNSATKISTRAVTTALKISHTQFLSQCGSPLPGTVCACASALTCF